MFVTEMSVSSVRVIFLSCMLAFVVKMQGLVWNTEFKTQQEERIDMYKLNIQINL